jgi:hypothetical protein
MDKQEDSSNTSTGFIVKRSPAEGRSQPEPEFHSPLTDLE